MPKRTYVIAAIVVGLLGGLGYYLYSITRASAARWLTVRQWFLDPASHPELVLKIGSRCGDAPFLFPTDGMVGFLWDDSFQFGHRHQGIDIFGGAGPGVTPVHAAYAGYLTRLPEWKSAVIVRVPSDPLRPGRQIWLYYTHMADAYGNSYIAADFPPGASERFIEAGTPLGFMGDYSGDSQNPVGVHLHFSIVLDDGTGHFKNELEIGNTLDPSPYFNLALNAGRNRDAVPVCEE